MSLPRDSQLARDGVALLKQSLNRSVLEQWAESIQGWYDALESKRACRRPGAEPDGLPPGEKFVPTASSVTLQGALGDACVELLVAQLARDGVTHAIGAVLGAAVLIDLDQSWVRRQYAPHHYPPLHAPHGWHQDGALGFDFGSLGAQTPPMDALLPMVTCWFPLGSCGSYAPGLEFVVQCPHRLLPVNDLTEAVVRLKFPAELFWRPVMDAGDVLLFCGDMLHRTYVSPAMTQDRTSIELRFFPADRRPARLAADRFVSLVLT
jgi:hypothetical protein